MRVVLLLSVALFGCGLHIEVLSDRGDASLDSSVSDSELDDTAFDGPPDDAPAGVGEDLAVGQYHSCAILRGALFCWGDNIDGALGLGDTSPRNAPTRVRFGKALAEVTGGEHFTCARTDAGEVYCFGTNADHELGLGDTDRRLIPTLVPLPRPAKRVAAGFEFACAILDDDSLYCWGSNVEGQVGQNEGFPSILAPRPLRVGSDNDWKTIAPGQGHACGIRGVGTLWCWGRNSTMELGLGDGTGPQYRTPTRVGTASDWIDVEAGQDTTCGIRTDGSLWCWGVNTFGQAGTAPSAPISTPRRVGTDSDYGQISVDTFSTCAHKKGGAVVCMGRNVEGQLGVGDNADRPSPTRAGLESDWTKIVHGRFHTCARKASGLIACAGANDRGQLGVGDNDRRNALTLTR
jgi:alpha-tubulin suppressor-like RCC1 family protein